MKNRDKAYLVRFSDKYLTRNGLLLGRQFIAQPALGDDSTGMQEVQRLYGAQTAGSVLK